jgi:hypothetical protein
VPLLVALDSPWRGGQAMENLLNRTSENASLRSPRRILRVVWLRSRLWMLGIVLVGQHRRANVLHATLIADDVDQVGAAKLQIVILAQSVELL